MKRQDPVFSFTVPSVFIWQTFSWPVSATLWSLAKASYGSLTCKGWICHQIWRTTQRAVIYFFKFCTSWWIFAIFKNNKVICSFLCSLYANLKSNTFTAQHIKLKGVVVLSSDSVFRFLRGGILNGFRGHQWGISQSVSHRVDRRTLVLGWGNRMEKKRVERKRT